MLKTAFIVRKSKSKEGNRIIRKIETFLNRGYELTDDQKCSYEFARIFSEEIGKRKKIPKTVSRGLDFYIGKDSDSI